MEMIKCILLTMLLIKIHLILWETRIVEKTIEGTKEVTLPQCVIYKVNISILPKFKIELIA